MEKYTHIKVAVNTNATFILIDRHLALSSSQQTKKSTVGKEKLISMESKFRYREEVTNHSVSSISVIETYYDACSKYRAEVLVREQETVNRNTTDNYNSSHGCIVASPSFFKVLHVHLIVIEFLSIGTRKFYGMLALDVQTNCN